MSTEPAARAQLARFAKPFRRGAKSFRAWFELEYYRDWWVHNQWEFSEPLIRFVEDECGLRKAV